MAASFLDVLVFPEDTRCSRTWTCVRTAARRCEFQDGLAFTTTLVTIIRSELVNISCFFRFADRGWIGDAFYEPDKQKSIGKWQCVFGEDFATQAATKRAGAVSKAARSFVRGSLVADGIADLVALVKRIGLAALPSSFDRLPHMRRPRWRAATSSKLKVNVGAQLWTSRYGQQIGALESLAPTQSGYWVRFNATNHMGLPFPDAYKVE